MIYPLVEQLAVEGVRVTSSCRVLGFSPQAFYKWSKQPCSARDHDDAALVNAIIDIHNDDPEFGYRFISDAIEQRVEQVDDRAWLSSSRGIRVDYQFSSVALPVIDEILADYGEFLDEVYVGAFPYPMPDPLPDSQCLPPLVDAFQPAALGLDVELTLDQNSRSAGGTVSATATVVIVGTETRTVAWGSSVLAGVGSGVETEGIFVGDVELPLNIACPRRHGGCANHHWVRELRSDRWSSTPCRDLQRGRHTFNLGRR